MGRVPILLLIVMILSSYCFYLHRSAPSCVTLSGGFLLQLAVDPDQVKVHLMDLLSVSISSPADCLNTRSSECVLVTSCRGVFLRLN